MNFGNLIEQLWNTTGYSDPSSDRQDWRVQMFKDAINAAIDEIVKTNAPRLFALQREGTLDLVAGTAIYTLNDYVARILSVYTTDVAAHQLKFVRPTRADAMGFRNPNIAYQPNGPYYYTDAMRSPIFAYGNSAGATTGATVAEGGQSVVIASLGGSLPTDGSMVGRMLRLNGESADYQIVSYTDNIRTFAVDRPILGRVSGVGTGGAGVGYTSKRWEVSPAGRMRIQILSVPTAAKTITYRYAALPRKLVGLDDIPEIQEEFHDLIWKIALRIIGAQKQNPEVYQMWMGEATAALAALRNADDDEVACSDGPPLERPGQEYGPGILPGTYSRGVGDGYWGGGVKG